MAEEEVWTGRRTIGSSHEYRDDIARFGPWQIDLVTQEIDRGAEAADDGDDIIDRLAEAICDGDRIVSPDHRAQIAAGGKLMMKPPVDHQKRLSVAHFPVDDTRKINPGLTHQPAAELDGGNGSPEE